MEEPNPQPLPKPKKPIRFNLSMVAFLVILAIGIFARTWEYNQIPAGLHQDEASQGIDAYDVWMYGMDRNGISYPLQFITWGDGEMVLYPYVSIPLIAWLGLTTLAIRLPNLIAGILLLPLVYLIGKKINGRIFGLIAMFILAISPWHIIGSRFGIMPYFMAFLFSLSVYFLIVSEFQNRWLLVAMLGFGLCCYTYSVAFAVVPVFILLCGWIYRKNLLKHWELNLMAAIGLLVLVFPILIYLYINTFDLAAVHLGRFTIPKLVDQPRFLTETGVLHSTGLEHYLENTLWMLTILWTGSDHWARNGIDPYGYAYPFAFLLALAGIGLIFFRKKAGDKTALFSLIAWFGACLPVGMIQRTLINRFCLIFVPITLLMAYSLTQLWNWKRGFTWVVICAYLAGFIGFTIAYHSDNYAQDIARDFNVGLIEAVEYSKQQRDSTVCFSKTITGAYVYVLYLEKPDPRSYLVKLGEYVNGANPFPTRHPLYRFRFRADRCPTETTSIHILRATDPLPSDGKQYHSTRIGQFVVLEPELSQ